MSYEFERWYEQQIAQAADLRHVREQAQRKGKIARWHLRVAIVLIGLITLLFIVFLATDNPLFLLLEWLVVTMTVINVAVQIVRVRSTR